MGREGTRLTANITRHLHFNGNPVLVARSFNFPPSSACVLPPGAGLPAIALPHPLLYSPIFVSTNNGDDTPCAELAATSIADSAQKLDRSSQTVTDRAPQISANNGKRAANTFGIDGATCVELASINTKGACYNELEQCYTNTVRSTEIVGSSWFGLLP